MAAVVVLFLNGILCPESYLYKWEKKVIYNGEMKKKFFFLKTQNLSLQKITNTLLTKRKRRRKGEMFQATLLALEVET